MEKEIKKEDDLDEKVVDKATNDSEDETQSDQEQTEEQVEEEQEDSKISEVEEVINKQQERIKELEDKHLRLYSEFDNYKRRTAKEKLALIEHASEDILMLILPILDDFERAINNDSDSKGKDEGIQLIYNKLIETLKKKGLEKVPSSIGKKMDVDIHEAITKIPAPKRKLKDKIVDEVECGYKLNGKIIRYAKVVIGE